MAMSARLGLSVQSKIELFDGQLEGLLKGQGIEPPSSRQAVIAKINQILKEINGKDRKT